jgi:hypothetical protein
MTDDTDNQEPMIDNRHTTIGNQQQRTTADIPSGTTYNKRPTIITIHTYIKEHTEHTYGHTKRLWPYQVVYGLRPYQVLSSAIPT